jgi:hypothetical protein
MFELLIAFIISAYSTSPLAFWGGAAVITICALGVLMLLGLCRVAGEADDWADERLAELRAEGA